MHFKNSRETAFALRKMDLQKAKKYLEAVLDGTRCIPFRRFCGGVGRTPQAKNEGQPNAQGRWPKKSVEFILSLLRNAESNAEVRAVPCAAGRGGGGDSRRDPAGGVHRQARMRGSAWHAGAGLAGVPRDGALRQHRTQLFQPACTVV